MHGLDAHMACDDVGPKSFRSENVMPAQLLEDPTTNDAALTTTAEAGTSASDTPDPPREVEVVTTAPSTTTIPRSGLSRIRWLLKRSLSQLCCVKSKFYFYLATALLCAFVQPLLLLTWNGVRPCDISVCLSTFGCTRTLTRTL